MARRAGQETLKRLLQCSGAGLVASRSAGGVVSVAVGLATGARPAVLGQTALWRQALQQGRSMQTWQPWAQRMGTSSSSAAAGPRLPARPLPRRGGVRLLSSSTPDGPSMRAARAAADAEQGRKIKDMGLYLFALIVGMVGVTYAAVPLYRMFCQATGFGGTVIEGEAVEEKLRKRAENRDEELEEACANREITVSFNADVDDSLPWRFVPTQRSVKVHPGQSTLAFYTAKNLSDKAVTGISTYNVAPQQVGAYFNKIQCFCFEEQRLLPGEMIDMPVFFYIDPEFALDQRLNGVSHITLSYTFFKVDEEEYNEDDVPAVAAVAALPVAAAPAAAIAVPVQ